MRRYWPRAGKNVNLDAILQSIKLSTVLLVFGISTIAPINSQGDPVLDDALTEALNLTPNVDNGRKIFRACAECHTAKGWGTVDGEFPQLAGQHHSVIIKQILDIRYGNRDNPTMLRFAQEEMVGGPQGLSDVAGYVSSLPANPEPGRGPGDNLEYGKQLYKRNCAKCHDENGLGDDEALFPRIQGQHYEYLLRQLKWIREGKRRNVYRGMVRKMRKMTVSDFEVVADYVSRLAPPSPD